VLIAEMLNTAVEAAIDIATTSFDPMAKLAKDIAAGAVLIATINGADRRLPRLRGKVADRSGELLDRLRDAPGRVDARRARPDDHHRDRDQGVHGPRHAAARRGSVGHAAVAFAGWMARPMSPGRTTASSSRRSH